jgi:hypothetical protein
MDKARRPVVSQATQDDLLARFNARPHWQKTLTWAEWLNVKARQRIANTPGLDAYEALLLDFQHLPYELTLHLMWIDSAPAQEILDWCEDIAWRAELPPKMPHVGGLVVAIAQLGLASLVLSGCSTIL